MTLNQPKEKIQTYSALRGIAAVFILFSHMHYLSDSKNVFWSTVWTSFMSKCAVCTTLFFICSGFFLNYTWKKDTSFGRYVKGKLKRIYPITLIVFLLALAVNLLLSGESDEVETAAVGSAPWLFNVAANVFLFKAFIPMESVFYSFHGPSWYISALFAFYLIAYPFMKGMYGEKKNQWRTITAVIAVIAYLLELLICIIVHIRALPYLWLCYVNPWFRIFGEGFAGILLCEYMPQIQNKLRSIKPTVLEVIGVVMLFAAIFLRNLIHLNINYAWIQLFFMGAVLIAFRQGKGKVSNLLNRRPFQFLGEISFELYMTHAFVYEGLPIICGFISKSIRQFLMNHPGTRFMITFVLCLVAAWVVHKFMDYLNKKIIRKI